MKTGGKGGKKAKAAKTTQGAGALNEKEQLLQADAELLSLRLQLQQKVLEAAEARKVERAWQARGEAALAAASQYKADIADLRAAMQKEACEEKLKLEGHLAELEAGKGELARRLEEKEAAIKQLQGKTAALQQALEGQEVCHQMRLEQMQAEFAQMLQETLDRLHTKLEDERLSAFMSTRAGPACSARSRAGRAAP